MQATVVKCAYIFFADMQFAQFGHYPGPEANGSLVEAEVRYQASHNKVMLK
jgi:hypothetical protein